jgi:cell division protein FtsB
MLWRLALAGLLLLNAFLVFQLVWGSNGLLRYFELKAMRGRLQTQVEQVRQENVRLSREIRLLKNSPEYIEKVIRSEMHYVQPGEIVYLREERK